MQRTVIDELIDYVAEDKKGLVEALYKSPIANMEAFNLVRGQIAYSDNIASKLESIKTRYEEGDLDE